MLDIWSNLGYYVFLLASHGQQLNRLMTYKTSATTTGWHPNGPNRTELASYEKDYATMKLEIYGVILPLIEATMEKAHAGLKDAISGLLEFGDINFAVGKLELGPTF